MNGKICELSLNNRIEGWKREAKEAQRREQTALDEREKAEAALRNMDRQRAAEKARADRAEIMLKALGVRLEGVT